MIGKSPNQTYITVSDVNEPNDDGSVPDISLSSLSYTLCCHREVFQYRFACEANDIYELIEQLISERVDMDLKIDALKQFMQGKSVNLKNFFDGQMKKLHVPGYTFNEKNHWFSDVL